MKVVIIGAGITGITTAYFFAKGGHQVTVIDKHRYSGMQTSYANGGQLSVSNSEVWTTWPTIAKGLKWMFKKDAPLLFNLSFSIPKYKWIIGFLLNTVMNNAEKNTEETIKLGLRARKIYYDIAKAEAIDFDLKKEGILHFYRNEKYLKSAETSCDLFQRNSVNRYMISKEEVINLEPSLINLGNKIVGGTYTPDDASGDIHKFCMELSKVLANSGVKFMYDSEAVRFDESIDAAKVNLKSGEVIECDRLIICTGSDTSSLFDVNIYPVKGYSITLPVGNNSLAPNISLLDEETKIVASRLGDSFRVAGTAELAGWNTDIRQDRIKPLVNWVRECFPQLSTEDIKPWAGLRPMSSNMLPIVKQITRRAHINSGHGHLGWTLAPATALITYLKAIECA